MAVIPKRWTVFQWMSIVDVIWTSGIFVIGQYFLGKVQILVNSHWVVDDANKTVKYILVCLAQHAFYSKFFIIQFIKFKRTNAKGKFWTSIGIRRFEKSDFQSWKFTKEMKCWSQQSKVSSIQHSKMKIISSNSNDEAFLTKLKS